jgi:hypothetical protein
MRKDTAKKFLEDNKEALLLLGDKLRQASDIRTISSEEEFRANKKAVEIIESWIGDLFSLTNYDIMEEREEDNLYKRLEQPET